MWESDYRRSMGDLMIGGSCRSKQIKLGKYGNIMRFYLIYFVLPRHCLILKVGGEYLSIEFKYGNFGRKTNFANNSGNLGEVQSSNALIISSCIH